MQKTKAQILEETITSYTIDTRAMATCEGLAACCYLDEDGRMCAVGRCLLDPGRFLNSASVFGLAAMHQLDDILKPPYRGHDVRFWGSLQALHDTEKNWDRNGLSPKGKLRARNIAREFQISLNEVPSLSDN